VSAAPASGLRDASTSAGSWYYTNRWGTVRDIPETITVRVGCGDAVPQDAAELPTQWWPDKNAEPYTLPDGRPALVAEDFDGTAVTWLQRPGAVAEVQVHRAFVAELTTSWLASRSLIRNRPRSGPPEWAPAGPPACHRVTG
jgi:hypothetical protein